MKTQQIPYRQSIHGGKAMYKESETIEYLVSILLTFTSDQMAAFVAGAQEIIAQYTPKN